MAVFETWLKSDLKKPVVVQKLSGNLFSADNGGNRIGVEVMDNGSPATLTGGVTGYMIREDGATVTTTGTLSGNKASIVLPSSAYVVVGHISIVIKVGTTTVGACVGYVYRTTTDTLVDPGHVIPSIEELLAKIADCEQATSNANSAASSANTAASSANSAASNANTKASLADQKATLADQKATLANTAAGTANTAASKIDNMTVSATGLPAGSTPTATISEVSGHKHIAFGLVKGDKGKDFHIAKTFSSVSAMMNYTGTDIEAYDFAMIDTGSVQDTDTGKLYCYEPDKTPKWQYIGDLSGAQGIKGETGTGIDHITLNQDYTLTIYLDDETSYTTTSIRGATGETPDISIGTVTTLNHDQSAYVVLDQSSTPEDPVFNFGIPRGEPGSAENVYGTTVPMSSTDSTKVATAINAKLDANQGSANAGKFMRVGSTGAVEYDLPTDRYSSLADFPATGDEGKLYIAEDTGMIYIWDNEYVPVGGNPSDECEVSGDIVSFETFESKAKKVVVDIDPVQDLHGYDNPWPAGGGKNLLNPGENVTANGVTKTVNSDGTIRINGTATATTDFYFNGTTSSGTTLNIPDGTYRLYGTENVTLSTYRLFMIYIKNGTTYYANGAEHTAIEWDNTTTGRLFIRVYSGATIDVTLKLSFVSGTQDAWSPYSNICPISGWTGANVTRTGKNLFDYTKITLDRRIDITNGNAVGVGSNDFWASDYTIVSGGKTYTMNFSYYSSANYGMACYDANKSFISGIRTGSATGTTPFTFTTPNNARYVRFTSYVPDTMPADEVMFETGSTSSAFEPYHSNTYQITFPSSAGTVYGGELTINQDGSGTLVVDKAYLNAADATWSDAGSGRVYTALPLSPTELTTVLCSHCEYHRRPGTGEYANWIDWGGYPDSNRNLIVTMEGITDTLSAWNTYIQSNNVEFMYCLESSVTYELTDLEVIALLQGQNNIWADCGAIDLTYYRTKTAYQVSLNTADIAELQNDFTGATASTDGAHGLVPAPEEGDQGKFLKGDGTWGNVPNPQVMAGATSSTDGASGLVPAPSAGDQGKSLFGDGTWKQVADPADVSANSQAITNLDNRTNSNTNATNDILADALITNTTKFFSGSGGSYTGSVPGGNYKYGTFMVNRRYGTKTVLAQSANNDIAINTYDGSSWTGWQELVTKSVESVQNVPFSTGTYYCSNSQTFGSVTIPSYCIYDLHVLGANGMGYAVRVTNGAFYVLYGSSSAWNAISK